jgi:hypothetical protein
MIASEGRLAAFLIGYLNAVCSYLAAGRSYEISLTAWSALGKSFVCREVELCRR